MLFQSFQFIFAFLPVVLIGVVVLSRFELPWLPKLWLLLASFFFYAYWNPELLSLLLFSIVFNYSLGIQIGKTECRKRCKTGLLVIGISSNLVLLGYYKYANFFITSINDFFGSEFDAIEVLLPLAISFFTFQQIAFLVDAYQDKCKESNFLNYSLFISFFPQLIAGPIVHHKEMMPQFEQSWRQRINHQNLALGLTLFSLGLFKKVIIADPIGVYSDFLFKAAASGQTLSIMEAWLAAIAFYVQVYFDFSAYSDMAIGIARLFGIRLPINFNSPLKATNVSDFWNRWHLTLTRFLRYYVSLPLLKMLDALPVGSGFLAHYFRLSVNALIVMLVIGLWHGAGWNFIVWGALCGLGLIVYIWWAAMTRRVGNGRQHDSELKSFAGWLITFLWSSIIIVFFRANNVSHALDVLGSMFFIGSNPLSAGWRGMFSNLNQLRTQFHDFAPFLATTDEALLFVGLGLTIALFLPNSYQWLSDHKPVLNGVFEQHRTGMHQWVLNNIRWEPNWKWGVATAGLTAAGIVFIDLSTQQKFIYFQF